VEESSSSEWRNSSLPTAVCVPGRSIEELEVRKRTGATILAVRHARTGAFDTNPSPDLRLEAGDMVIAIGTFAEMAKLEELIATPPTAES